jgi:L-fucose mutarotase/ribose pyranase (RbsD/FucU family)
VRFSASAPVPELLHVFVRRIGHGVDVRIVDAEFGDDVDGLDGLMSVTLPEPAALPA